MANNDDVTNLQSLEPQLDKHAQSLLCAESNQIFTVGNANNEHDPCNGGDLPTHVNNQERQF
ncbi:unnamed protein product [Arabis nemorensis]|uniref:Uncharacterized protein n=1 Tax=Arabis nemorensis TaxID=586526 RepID=A0A565BA55_9BRAS|nr:unnamed protein product [Arabis nemorensis]